MLLTGTFLDEISHDIPSQNWSAAEWERDFRTMQSVGIDTVILIRCGHKRWMTYPSEVLAAECDGFKPPADLVRMFLDLSQECGMSFYFGTYDSGRYWHAGEHQRELDISHRVVDEAWRRYGDCPAFRGWYLSLEISRANRQVAELYARLAAHCREVSGGLPVLISPYIAGVKAVHAFDSSIRSREGISAREHEREWDEVMGCIAGSVDIVAFQDGHVDFEALPQFLEVNRSLAERHGLRCWTNSETFDRDMPIKFLPIKWEKLLLKLQAAERAGVQKAITFEFAHFLSPHSCYAQAHGLFARYCEHFGLTPPQK
ncbi:MAG: DUF4434 domain-containing protein [Candidatus Brocadiae bacterium]|nr:DUF4434 domain-containing protein [Candidatus Brocadiia bacterium]